MELIAKPFGMLLMWLYEITSNYGVAVILFALIVKIILMPFQMKSKKEYTTNKSHHMLKPATLFHSLTVTTSTLD